MRRKRYQFGSVRLVPRKNGPGVWVFRYYDNGGKRITKEIGHEPMTRAQANKTAEAWRLLANSDRPAVCGVTFGAVLDRYIKDEMPSLEFTTSKGYTLKIKNYIRPRWGDYQISEVRPFGVEQWLLSLGNLGAKSKGHIKTIMLSVFNCAMRWEFIPSELQNPMRLIRVPGVSKRQTKPRVISSEQFWRLYAEISDEQTKMIALLAICLGLSISEATGLKWGDLNIEAGTLSIRRKAVTGKVGKTKTETRYADLPIDKDVREFLATYKLGCFHKMEDDWIFPAFKNHRRPVNGWNLQQRHLRPAAKAAELGESLGFHSLRHSYSTMLRDLGVDMKVQQELMRHADIRTTLNVYTQSVGDAQRLAQSLAVRSVMTGRIQ